MAKEIEKQAEVAMDPQLTMMAQAFAAAMASNNQSLAESIKALAPKPEIVEGSPEYRARQEAEGWFDSFDVNVYQNAYEAQARGETAEVRYRAARLKPGKYIKGRVTVEVDANGVHLLYPVKNDAMMINQQHWSSFGDLINKIWAEQEARELVKA